KRIESDFKYSNIETIYNPIDIGYIQNQSKENLDYKYILAVGRMQDDIKQFDKLIESYSKSDLPKKNIRLVILGDGILKNQLVSLVKSLKLENKIYFEGKVKNPFKYYTNSLYTVLSSKHEGFPMVLIESLACGTPVISFDCPSGPSEIITNHHNGILVENQNFDELTLAMNVMIDNKELYLHCKQNAKSSVEKFSIEKIGVQWLELMKIK
ncbi:glycosyltransferase, partial [Flavobacterium sp.]|uniref:glycosyltransferase n=1 Tax=Flavobacterium sp. TaxID=239 RepID=UPI0038FC8072